MDSTVQAPASCVNTRTSNRSTHSVGRFATRMISTVAGLRFVQQHTRAKATDAHRRSISNSNTTELYRNIMPHQQRHICRKLTNVQLWSTFGRCGIYSRVIRLHASTYVFQIHRHNAMVDFHHLCIVV